jgi:hypothetical protein
LENEALRFNRFPEGVLGKKAVTSKKTEIDIRNYAKYILREGGEGREAGDPVRRFI